MDGWNNRFLLGWLPDRCELLVSGSVLEMIPMLDSFRMSFHKWVGKSSDLESEPETLQTFSDGSRKTVFKML